MSAAPGWRHDFVLAFLPVPGITPAVETGNHHNPVLLNLEEYSIGEAPHSRTAKVAIDNSELQWRPAIAATVVSTASAKRSPNSVRMLSYHARASSKSSFASGIQTTGSVTVS